MSFRPTGQNKPYFENIWNKQIQPLWMVITSPWFCAGEPDRRPEYRKKYTETPEQKTKHREHNHKRYVQLKYGGMV